MPRLIVGFCGPESAGKSTAGRMLLDYHFGVTIPFALPLKEMLAAIGVDNRHLYGAPAEKEEPLPLLQGKSARYALQRLGTEWGRDLIGPGLWVDAWRQAVDDIANDDDIVVADDVRFPNEIDAILSRGGIVICIVRSLDDVFRVPKHPSENFATLKYSHVVVNDKDTAQLAEKVAQIVRSRLLPTAYAQSA
jgi:hypothetical protein